MDINKVVLIVEDEPPINEILTQFLIEEGYKVLNAFSVSEALTILQSVTCNLIVLDFNLPGADGNAFLNLLPENMQSIPVIGVSATPDKFKSRPQIKAVVAKPYDLFKLGEQVEKFSS